MPDSTQISVTILGGMALLMIVEAVAAWIAAEWWYVKRPLKQACDLCGWMPRAGHAPVCPRWKPKEAEMERMAKEFVQEIERREAERGKEVGRHG